ncbi:MAG: hypothetical protein HOQ29_21675 [Acidobacteria bacterium]|nr:hypothetical protein [Acidobacteriota bacterium]
MRVLDTVAGLAQMTRRLKGDAPAAAESGVPPPTALGQIETRLAGVVVAALKEAFDRDRARMDLERAHLDAERQRAEEALRAELRRQAADRALGQVRLVALMAMGIWMLSAALAVWMPGMRDGFARGLLGGGWVFVLGALGCAFSGWQRIAAWSAADAGPGRAVVDGPHLAEILAPWLLLSALALCGASLLVAL